MELYNFYSMGSLIASLFVGSDLKEMTAWGAIGGGVVWLALFLLQGAGLCAMAKRLNMKKRWLAFLPFANIFYLGKIVGACYFFGRRMKNAGLYAMIAQIVCSILTVGYIFAEVYLVWNYPPMVDELGTFYWVGLEGFAGVTNTFYEVGGYLISIVSLVAQILLIILMMGLYKKYSPRNHRFLAILTFFIPMARFIAIFALRKREPFDYEGYMRRQREEYLRRQQYYNQQGGYNGGYNNSPYGMGGYQGMPQQPQQPQPPVAEPFDEFDPDKKGSDGAGSNANDTGDGFFDSGAGDGFFD